MATPSPAAQPTAQSDVELLLAHRAGDAHALGTLYARHHARVRSVCRRFVGDEATADDLAQETFHSVMRHAHRVDSRYNVASWLLSIAANLARDELRRRTRWLRLVQPADEHVELAVLREPDRDRWVQPEAALEIAETRDLVYEVADLLPQRQREALLLREIGRMPQAEIARRLGTTSGAVGTLLFRARERFREELLSTEGDWPELRTGCAAVTELRGAAGPRRPRPAQRQLVDEHLASCGACRRASIPSTVTA